MWIGTKIVSIIKLYNSRNNSGGYMAMKTYFLNEIAQNCIKCRVNEFFIILINTFWFIKLYVQ